jgi:prephenate dehydrogenase
MKIAVIGVGKMGSWFANQLAPLHDILVYDQDSSKSDGLPTLKSLSDLNAWGPDLLLNCVPLSQTLSVFEDVAKIVPVSTTLCDVASVKTGLPEFYAFQKNPFLSLHPMFGPTFADLDSLREENAIIIRDSFSSAKSIFLELFAKLGVRVFEFSFAEHDKMMAYSLTTPFVASLMFALCVDETAVPGTTFAKHKKIAEGLLKEDSHLLGEILFNPSSIHQIDAVTSKLEFLKHVIKARDQQEIDKLVGRLKTNLGLE